MIIIDLFDIDFHIFTVIKFLFNLVVRFKYIWYIHIDFHIFTVIKFLFNLGVRIKYVRYIYKMNDDDDDNNSYEY